MSLLYAESISNIILGDEKLPNKLNRSSSFSAKLLVDSGSDSLPNT